MVQIQLTLQENEEKIKVEFLMLAVPNATEIEIDLAVVLSGRIKELVDRLIEEDNIPISH